MPREQLTRLARAANHQGVVAVTAEKQYNDVDDILATRRGEKTDAASPVHGMHFAF